MLKASDVGNISFKMRQDKATRGLCTKKQCKILFVFWKHIIAINFLIISHAKQSKFDLISGEMRTCLYSIASQCTSSLTDELTLFATAGAPRVLRSMTMAHSSAAGLNERLSGWVAVWPTDFQGLYPAEESWGVLWSVILDPELHSGRIRNPKDLWESISCEWQLLSSDKKKKKNLLCQRREAASVVWDGEEKGERTVPAIAMKWPPKD